jgi:TetR/AcrR family transcriptional regulator, repressor for uid operon
MRKIDPAKQQAKRQQIVDAAIVCFAKQGFHATSTAQICAQAGMSPGNLFHYFPTKDAIIQAIAELDRAETATAFDTLATASNVVVGLKALARDALVAASDPAHCALSLELTAEAVRNPAVATMFEANERLTHRNLVVLLKQGVDRGHVEPSLDLDQCAAWLIAIFEGAILRAALDRNADLEAQHQTLSQLMDRFLAPY